MEYIPTVNMDRIQIHALLAELWGSTDVVVHGTCIDLREADGIAAVEDGRILGLITYFIKDGLCEITSLNSLEENKGIGTGLIQAVTAAARQADCRKIFLITTNDNIRALKFYQKRGFDMVHLYYNALETARKQKPQIPLTGQDGIPLKHEIEMELLLPE